ncbi:tRNA pseudouridine synthase A [Roseivirga misakiensis]|uniref:tRNA pseudouridine synthase A n=1 Tax=Roseivirga misakiensis TaxID=1563681 RepID=A0A1E5T0H9_9BACT|nr:pseudouridine synthase [Roseivirga misakiensis]OEK04883.1 pseudouridine synthase [Roseivirga misakiensis]
MKHNFYYLLHIQYLGFRFHGWAKQPQVKTVHHMVDRTLSYVFDHSDFKTLGGSRTDAMVSADHFVLELFLKSPITNEKAFLDSFNLNLPSDIRALAIEATDPEFNIIQNPKSKTYLYLFAFGEKAHPFSAPFITTFSGQLDLEQMKRGAELFEGTHEFRAYCKKPSEKTNTIRTIDKCEIVPNTFYSASFFPENSFALHIKGKGFMRNQIRIMMGQLVRLGQGEIGLKGLESSLKADFSEHLSYIVPASGLTLKCVDFK